MWYLPVFSILEELSYSSPSCLFPIYIPEGSLFDRPSPACFLYRLLDDGYWEGCNQKSVPMVYILEIEFCHHHWDCPPSCLRQKCHQTYPVCLFLSSLIMFFFLILSFRKWNNRLCLFWLSHLFHSTFVVNFPICCNSSLLTGIVGSFLQCEYMDICSSVLL